jgi:integrase
VEEDNLYRLLWLLYFRTGLRASAGVNFEWEWILWDERAAILPESHNKSRSDFWLPLDDDLFSAFEARRAMIGPDKAQGRVFPLLDTRRVQRRFRGNCKKAGIDRTELCLHSIRHTYATMCFESSGNNVKVVQELLCHSDGSTTLKYIHASAQQKRKTVEQNALRLRMPGDQMSDDQMAQEA